VFFRGLVGNFPYGAFEDRNYSQVVRENTNLAAELIPTVDSLNARGRRSAAMFALVGMLLFMVFAGLIYWVVSESFWNDRNLR
jgi:hypothetical protein